MNKIPFLFALGVVAALVVGGITGYVMYSKSTIDEDVKKYDFQVSSLENEIVQYEGENLEAAVSAKEALDTLKGSYIEWSDVIEKVLSTTPKNSTTRAPLVEYTSYSGSQNNQIGMNVRTVPGSKFPFADVAELIRAFTGSKYFTNPFVPSISTGYSDDGDLLLVFNFNVEFVSEIEVEKEVEKEEKDTDAAASSGPSPKN